MSAGFELGATNDASEYDPAFFASKTSLHQTQWVLPRNLCWIMNLSSVFVEYSSGPLNVSSRSNVSSRTYSKKIRGCAEFCVNVLGENKRRTLNESGKA